MKNLKFLFLLSLLITGSVFACPELEGVDLADGDNRPALTEISEVPYRPNFWQFVEIPGFSPDQYEACKDAFVVRTYRSDVSGKVYSAILSVEDSCDGGNSYGGLYTEDLGLVLGSISDSFISCL